MGNPFATRTELLILGLLTSEPAGMYGLALVAASNGKLKRGTVYITLGRLEEKGFIKSVEDRSCGHSGLPRPRYKLTAQGVRILAAAELLGINCDKGVTGANRDKIFL
jgi:DNA-binding PadR family transcriptional regulator